MRISEIGSNSFVGIMSAHSNATSYETHCLTYRGELHMLQRDSLSGEAAGVSVGDSLTAADSSLNEDGTFLYAHRQHVQLSCARRDSKTKLPSGIDWLA